MVEFRSTARMIGLIGVLVCATPSFIRAEDANAKPSASVRSVNILGKNGAVEIEIEASERMTPQALVLTSPDRLVLDFANARPASTLHSHGVNRGNVKSVRVGLFSSNPPTTRIVVDMNAPMPYQLFPQGKAIIVKFGDGATAGISNPAPPTPVVVKADYVAGSNTVPAPAAPKSVAPAPVASAPAAQPAVAKPVAPAPVVAKPNPLEVIFRDGLLSIHANKVSLSDVLNAVQQQTHAEIVMPPGAEQERVAVSDGPAPAADVIARLLNGSRFNFMIINSATDPRVLAKVVLTPRPEGSYAQNPATMRAPADDDDQVGAATPPSLPIRVDDVTVAETQPQADNNQPDEAPAPPNTAVAPNSNTFPNARPTVVKPDQQPTDSPDY